MLYESLVQLFYAIGLLAPVAVLGKLFMKQIWKLKGEWNEYMLNNDYWSEYRIEHAKLSRFRISRHIFGNDEYSACIQIHGFADASEKTYGSVIYVGSMSSMKPTSINSYVKDLEYLHYKSPR